MIPTPQAMPPLTAPVYGFQCEIDDKDFARAVARVAHEVRVRLERVKSALVSGAPTDSRA
ncbi:MAG: hypothetical protein K2X51_05155 [Burkholderiales bacterium]|nr:hypothetical protein [Burkholderiales bacterium]